MDWGKKVIRKSTNQKEPFKRPEKEEDARLKRLREQAHSLEADSYTEDEMEEDTEEANKATRFKKLKGYWKK